MNKTKLSLLFLLMTLVMPTCRYLSVLTITTLPLSSFAEDVDDQTANEIDSQVEDDVDSQVEDDVDSQVEDDVDSQVEDDVDSQVEDDVDSQVEDDVDNQIEDNTEAQAEGGTENQAEGEAENQANNPGSYRAAGDFNGASMDEGDGASRGSRGQYQAAKGINGTMMATSNSAGGRRAENAIINAIENEDGSFRIKGELLLLADEATIGRLKALGFDVKTATELTGFGQFLIEVKEPSKGLNVDANLEFNHLYKQQGDTLPDNMRTEAFKPSITQINLVEVISHFSDVLQERTVSIGVIDSEVDQSHLVFSEANITSESFILEGQRSSVIHGTAISSILVGKSDQMAGLIPSAKIFSANVFFLTENNEEYATVKSLILALDWMLKNHVDVINMSLSGPQNPLLESALNYVKSKGVLVIAAAGNNGPASAATFPAAYKSVIAVTAVNENNVAYFNASRGTYIDLAALGVNVYHASPLNQYGVSTGTSYAVPFVTAIAACLIRLYPLDEVENLLYQTALDLGPKGKDIIYGYGLAQFVAPK